MNDKNTSASGVYLGDNDASRNGLESVPPATDGVGLPFASPEALAFADECAGLTDRELLVSIYISQRQTQTVVEGIIAQAQSNPMISGILGL